MVNVDKLLKQSLENLQELKNLEQELLNNPEICQEIKDGIIEIQNKFENQRLQDEENREKNKHRKIIGYNPDNFEPIYEDE